MAQWSNQIPVARDYANIRLLRVAKTGSKTGIILSETIEGCVTHWDSFRTLPCIGKDCPFCAKNQPGRWHAFLCLANQVSSSRYVLQITQTAALDLQQQAAPYGYLRGLLASFQRTAPRANAPIHVEVRNFNPPLTNLPDAVNIPAFMDVIWAGGRRQTSNRNGQPEEPQ